MFPHKDTTLKAEKEEWAAPLMYSLDAGVTERKVNVLERFLLSVKCYTDNKIEKFDSYVEAVSLFA